MTAYKTPESGYKTCDPRVLTKCEVLKISQKFGSCTCVGMNIRKVAESEMFVFLPAEIWFIGEALREEALLKGTSDNECISIVSSVTDRLR